MEIFIDSLDLDEIEYYNNLGILSGVTTNPTMTKKFGYKLEEYPNIIRKVREIIGNKEIHIEAIGKTAEEILLHSDSLLSTGKNIVFKIPFNKEGVDASNKLTNMGYKTNLHLVSNLNQALLASSVKSTYICILEGRMFDFYNNFSSAYGLLKNKFDGLDNLNIKTMLSSVRHSQHVIDAIKLNYDCVTIPPHVLNDMFYDKVTKDGIERFNKDLK